MAVVTDHAPTVAAALNAAVTRVKFQSPVVAAGAVARGSATVENFAAAELHDLLEVRVGTQRVTQRAVDVAAGSATEVAFEFPLPPVTGDSVHGTVSIQDDHLSEDNRQFFWLAVYQPPRVVVVEGQQAGPDSLHSGF